MPDKTTLRVWYLCLIDLTVQQFAVAVQRYLTSHSKEFVTVQLIRELSGAQEACESAGIDGWEQVLREIKRVGAYRTPEFSDKRTAATIRHLGGWVAICDKQPDELHKWTRQTFLKTFNAMPARAESRLTNLIEQENARTGMTEAAAEVMARIEYRQQEYLICDGI